MDTFRKQCLTQDWVVRGLRLFSSRSANPAPPQQCLTQDCLTGHASRCAVSAGAWVCPGSVSHHSQVPPAVPHRLQIRIPAQLQMEFHSSNLFSSVGTAAQYPFLAQAAQHSAVMAALHCSCGAVQCAHFNRHRFRQSRALCAIHTAPHPYSKTSSCACVPSTQRRQCVLCDCRLVAELP